MIAGLSRTLIDEFYRSAADDAGRKALLRERVQGEAELVEQARLEKVRHDDEERDRWEQSLSALATPKEVAAFEIRLDSYDAATIAALLDNRHAFDRSQEQLERLRADAFKLPDGRRVFATAKGDEVFDESGARVGRDVIDPQAIPAGKPTYEDLVAVQGARQRLDQKHNELLAFQAQLDAMRERVGKGDLSKKDLDGLAADLEAGLPPAVAAHLAHDHDGKPDVSPARPSTVDDAAPIRTRDNVRSLPANTL